MSRILKLYIVKNVKVILAFKNLFKKKLSFEKKL